MFKEKQAEVALCYVLSHFHVSLLISMNQERKEKEEENGTDWRKNMIDKYT